MPCQKVFPVYGYKSCGMWDSGIIKMVEVLISDHKLVPYHTVKGVTEIRRNNSFPSNFYFESFETPEFGVE